MILSEKKDVDVKVEIVEMELIVRSTLSMAFFFFSTSNKDNSSLLDTKQVKKTNKYNLWCSDTISLF